MKIEAPCEKCLVGACCTGHQECTLFDKYFWLNSLVRYYNDNNKGITVDKIFLDMYKNKLINISKDTISMNIEKHLDENHMALVRSKYIEEFVK